MKNYKYKIKKEFNDYFPFQYRVWSDDESQRYIKSDAVMVELTFGTDDSKIEFTDYSKLTEYLNTTLYQKFRIAGDDPYLESFKQLEGQRLYNLVIVPTVSLSTICNNIMDYVNTIFIYETYGANISDVVKCVAVKVTNLEGTSVTKVYVEQTENNNE